MSEINDLYQEVILDHNKSPRNFGELQTKNRCAHGHNPLCGDQIDIQLDIDSDNIIKDIKFTGEGCAISKASASLLTTMVKGKTVEEAKQMFDKFHHVVTMPVDEEPDMAELGKLAVFSGVREFPARVKCASLAWHTMIDAIDEKDEC